MRKTKNLNNLNEKFLKQYQMKPGQVVTYKYLNTTQDSKGVVRGPIGENIRSTFSVYDGENTVDVAYIARLKGNDEIERGTIEFLASEGYEITLNGSNAEDREKYTIMELSPENAANFERDGVPSLFKKVEPEKDAAQRRADRFKRDQAVEMARNLNEDQVRAFALALGKNKDAELETLRDIIEDFAENTPDTFLERSITISELTKALVVDAENAGIIEHKTDKGDWIWKEGGGKICNVPRGPKPGKHNGLVEFLNGSAEGAAVLEELKLRLKK